MRRHRSTVLTLSVLATLMSALPVGAIDARTSIVGGMCSPWTTKQVSSAMKEQMKVVREDPDYCVWYSKKDHSGNISTLSASLWGGDPSSGLSLLEQARGETWRNWTSEDTVAGVPTLLTAVRRSGKNREITAAAFPDDITWLDLNATSVIGTDVRKAVRKLVEIAAPTFAVEAGASPSASASAPVETATAADGPPAACELLTVEEVAHAVDGESMTLVPGDDPARCDYMGDQGSFLVVGIDVADPSATMSLVEQRRFLSPEATDTRVHDLPALVSSDATKGTSSVFVYPNEGVEISLILAVMGATDVEPTTLTLAETAVTRAVEAGLPAPPSQAPPTPSTSVGAGLCSILSAEEASTALGGAAIEQTVSQADGCAHMADGSSSAVFLEILRDDRSASIHEGMAQISERFELAGMPAGQQEMPPASIVVLLPDDATAVMLTVGGPEGLDVHATTRALAELVAPRVKAYLGL